MNVYFDSRAERYQARSHSGLWWKIRRIEKQAVFDLLAPQAGEKIVDLGCGAGFYTKYLTEEFRAIVTAVDQSPAMITALTRQGIKGILSKAEDVRLKDQQDAAVLAGVLEFIGAPQQVFENLKYHLKPQGRFVMLVPQQSWWGRGYVRYHQLFGHPAILRSVGEYVQMAEQEGFQLSGLKHCSVVSSVLLFTRS